MRSNINTTGKERFFDESEIIVSKTDPGGRIVYANDVFLRIAGYREDEILDKPHSILRHPDMPRCIFKYMWDTLASGSEIFVYVVNVCKNGDHYWVLAHVTPSFDKNGKIVGYHSNRRVPARRAVDASASLYKTLLAEEKKHNHSITGMQSAHSLFTKKLADKNVGYDEFLFSLDKAS